MSSIERTVSQDFLSHIFFIKSSSPKPPKRKLGSFRFFSKFRGDTVLASQGAPAANFATSSPCVVVDTGGKFATGVSDTCGNGVNDAGGKLPPVSMTPVANNGNNIRLLRP
jgi:hypothetical protein